MACSATDLTTALLMSSLGLGHGKDHPMKRDCPHCFFRVLRLPDGTCPSCRGDMSVAKTLPLTTVRIRLGDELPPLCVACGQRTQRVATIQRAMTAGGQ